MNILVSLFASTCETHFPFGRFIGVDVNDEFEDQHRQLALEMIYLMSEEPPEDHEVPEWISSAVAGSEQWRRDLAQGYCMRSVLDVVSDDAVGYPQDGPCPCGGGNVGTLEHYSHILPPSWLRKRVVFGGGHQLTETKIGLLSDTVFCKGLLKLRKVQRDEKEVVIPVQVLDLASWPSLISPDKDHSLAWQSVIRPAAMLSKLLLPYGTDEVWPVLGTSLTRNTGHGPHILLMSPRTSRRSFRTPTFVTLV